MDSASSDDPVNVAMKIILPVTVYGSPRFYSEAFQDAMSIVKQHNKPDLLITFMCNPKWPEIKSALNPGEQACDRPDLPCKVFILKLTALMEDILKQEILGTMQAHTATIEFQKRGLPHATSCLSWTGRINQSLQLSLMRSSVWKFQIKIRIHCSSK